MTLWRNQRLRHMAWKITFWFHPVSCLTNGSHSSWCVSWTWARFCLHTAVRPEGFLRAWWNCFGAAAQQLQPQLRSPKPLRSCEHGTDYCWFTHTAPCTEAITHCLSLPIQAALAKYKTDSTINMRQWGKPNCWKHDFLVISRNC